jgi:predicted hotdog family 3-hydroxylacyl-ACP dehydratase
MAGSIPDIGTLIPQGPPFVMVDRLLEVDGPTTTTSFLVTAENPLTADGRFSVAGLIENMAQSAAAGAGYAARAAGGVIRSGVIVAIHNFRIVRLPEVGDELITTITVTAGVADIVVISGRITCGQGDVATGEMKILTGV